MSNYDLVVIGAGPGGYIAAIRASQLGKKVAIIEKDKLGGVCLNRGCIPTKALLTSAKAAQHVKDLEVLGIDIELKGLNFNVAVKRANDVADKISKGVEFLMKKNKIDVIKGEAKFLDGKTLKVGEQVLKAKHYIIATGAKYRTFPGLEHDGKNIIGAWEAVKLDKKPKTMAIIGAGAIGVEFAYFWKSFGVDVHIFERENRLLPIEDDESSLELKKAYTKLGIKMTLGVESIAAKTNSTGVSIEYTHEGKKQKLDFEKCLLAVGMIGQMDGLNLEKAGVEVEKGFVKVNQYYQTTQANIYAIGDCSGPPLLAHAASHEGVLAAEHLSGKKVHSIDKRSIPGCTYCQPQVASVGWTERELKEKNMEYSVGKVPFMANGKAMASLETEGYVKVLLGKYGELLGAHIVGAQATELIHEYVLMRTMEGIDEDIMNTIHPHPTLGEFLGEAVLAAKKRALNY